jgi:hypothetical protein
MGQAWTTLLKTRNEKSLSMNRLCMVAHGVILIVGFWLALVAFIMRDILCFLLFMAILLAVYALTAFHLHRITRGKEASPIHKQESKFHLTGFAAIHFGESGTMLTMFRRP